MLNKLLIQCDVRVDDRIRTVLLCMILACYSSTGFSQDVKDVFYKVIREGQENKSLSSIQKITGPLESLDMLTQRARQAYRNDSVYLGFIYYEKILSLYPNENDIRLEYAESLYESGVYEYSTHQLRAYLERGGERIEAFELLGNALLWQAEYHEARAIFEKIVERDPHNPLAKEGLDNINSILSPYINIEHKYQRDDQPLQSHTGALEFKMYRNQFLAPRLSMQYFNFSSEDALPPQDVIWWNAGNRFQWVEGKLFLDANVGYYDDLSSHNDQLNYDISLGKSWAGEILTSVSYGKNPYFTTAASIEQEVSVEQLEFKLSRSFEFRLNGEAAYRYKRYYDGNEGNNYYAYLMYSLIRSNKVNIKFGYGFNYDNANESRFYSLKSLEEVISSGMYDNIEGRYDPYFTPNEQMSHSVLANVQISVNNWIQILAGSGISLYASSQIPYIYLGESDQNEIEFKRGFQKEGQDIIELRAGMNLNPADFIQISLQFEYQNLFFYEQYNFSSGVNFRF